MQVFQLINDCKRDLRRMVEADLAQKREETIFKAMEVVQRMRNELLTWQTSFRR